ncbi:MAG TPA: glycosyltransferase family 2 protein [Terriglobia bacterium]|nr:glycosyltransferase family 2 protein [Terriglobia bacterium]
MISIIILVHNKLELTQRCLSALAGAVGNIEHEVLCIDQASTENVAALQDAASKFRRFRFIRNQQNLSFSAANNRAAAASIGDKLLFLNNDVMAARGSVEALLATLAEDPLNGIAGPKLVYPSGRVQHAGIAQMLWGYVSNYGVGGDAADSRFQQTCERFAVTGAMACLPRNVFERVGGFDERYSWGYEDVDLSLKVRAAGFRVLYVPKAESIHEESATLSSLRNPGALAHNYQTYRTSWDHELTQHENAYIDRLQESGVRRVVMLGMGQAAFGLAGILSKNGIETQAFTSCLSGGPDTYCGRPAVPLESLRDIQFDRLVVASQFFFEFEKSIQRYDPAGAPIFPAVA